MVNTPNIWVILVAGGTGVRFGAHKQFETLGDKSVLDWSLETARSVSPNIVVVLPDTPSPTNTGQSSLFSSLSGDLLTTKGGQTRSASVRAGLQKIKQETNYESVEMILIHDAVRPLVQKELFLKVIQAIKDGADAAVPCIPIADTIHTTDGEVIDRTKLMCLQTPQAFRPEILREVHESEPEASDDISLCTLHNKKVTYVKGDSRNLKITEPQDLKIASSLIQNSPVQKPLQEGGT